MVYGEGLYMGYRHYERAKIAPLFPFGHGLSYSTFEFGRPSLSSKVLTANSTVEIIIAVTNVSGTAGAEIVQVYVNDEKSRLPRPEKELVAFEKVFLAPGETKHVRLYLDRYAVGYYDTSISRWIAEEGRFNVLIGASSADIRFVLGSLPPPSPFAPNFFFFLFPSRQNLLTGSLPCTQTQGVI